MNGRMSVWPLVAGPNDVDWRSMSTVVSTESLKYAVDSPASSQGDLTAAGCEVPPLPRRTQRSARLQPGAAIPGVAIPERDHTQGPTRNSSRGTHVVGGHQQRRLRLLLLLRPRG